jgi:hypothetical protein
MLQPEIEWHPRPRTLREFPEDTQVRLRQLDFNRTIVVHIGNDTVYIRRHCCPVNAAAAGCK